MCICAGCRVLFPPPEPESTESPTWIRPEPLAGNARGSSYAAPRRGLHYPSEIPLGHWGNGRSGSDKPWIEAQGEEETYPLILSVLRTQYGFEHGVLKSEFRRAPYRDLGSVDDG
jgi:hypothetical protein